MRKKYWTKAITLRDIDIDHLSEWLDEVQLEVGVERKNRMRVRLLVEDILLRTRDHFGEGVVVATTCHVSFGHPRLRIDIQSAPFNPLNISQSQLGSWESSLSSAIGLSTQYSLEGGHNIIRLALPSANKSPVSRIWRDLLIGAFLGLVGLVFIPDQLLEATTNVVFTPVFEMWNRVLNAISGPIIFFTVATSMLNTQRIEERGGSSLLVIVRYFLLSFFVVWVAMMCSLPFFPLEYAGLGLSWGVLRELFDSFLHVIPANIFDPFLGSNTSQLLFLAFVLGYILVLLGNRVDLLRRFVRQTNVVGLQLAVTVSYLVPIVAGLFICLEIWQRRVRVLAELWQPLVIALSISMLVLLAWGMVLARHMKMSFAVLFKKLKTPFLMALRTGSLDESFEETQSSCSKLLGIDAAYVKVGLPQGLVLYMPISAIGTIAFTLFAADSSNIRGDTVWFLSAIIMAVVVFVATPPVPGANLLAYVALFAELGISESLLLDAMIFDILFGVFAGAANQCMLQLEMVRQAHRFGLLDQEVLRRPIEEK